MIEMQCCLRPAQYCSHLFCSEALQRVVLTTCTPGFEEERRSWKCNYLKDPLHDSAGKDHAAEWHSAGGGSCRGAAATAEGGERRAAERQRAPAQLCGHHQRRQQWRLKFWCRYVACYCLSSICACIPCSVGSIPCNKAHIEILLAFFS